jgi:hypothetical protein
MPSEADEAEINAYLKKHPNAAKHWMAELKK